MIKRDIDNYPDENLDYKWLHEKDGKLDELESKPIFSTY